MTIALLVITSLVLLLTVWLILTVRVLNRDLDVIARMVFTLARGSLPPDLQAELHLDDEWRRIGGGQ